jgi:hypothetical protein
MSRDRVSTHSSFPLRHSSHRKSSNCTITIFFTLTFGLNFNKLDLNENCVTSTRMLLSKYVTQTIIAIVARTTVNTAPRLAVFMRAPEPPVPVVDPPEEFDEPEAAKAWVTIVMFPPIKKIVSNLSLR